MKDDIQNGKSITSLHELGIADQLTMCQIMDAPTKLQLEQQCSNLSLRLLYSHHGYHKLFAFTQSFKALGSSLSILTSLHVISE